MKNTQDTTNITMHPYAEILRAIADGKKIEYKNYTDEWCEVDNATALGMISVAVYTEFRIKPEVILINGIEVPKPCSNALAPETIYYIPYLEAKQVDYRWTSISWDNDSYDLHMLKLGLVHLTKEAAIKHAEALLSFTQQG